MSGLKKIWELLLEIIYPHTIHGRLVSSIDSSTLSELYYPRLKNNIWYLTTYREPRIQALIASAKFEGNTTAQCILSSIVEQWLQNISEPTLLIPIPLHSKRQRKRGYNQVLEVINKISLPHIIIEPALLIRQRHTTPQTSLQRTERKQNMSGAFRVDTFVLSSVPKNVTRIIICDDVLTTGATLEAARATLAPHLPPHVTLLCLAWSH